MPSFYSTIKHAKQMDIPVEVAIGQRLDYLNERRLELNRSHKNVTNATDALFLFNQIKEVIEETRYLKNYDDKKYEENEITPGRIEQAKQHPVSELVELKGNRCMAFCHDSDSYSMSKCSRVNKLHCHVCNKTFDSIDIIMHMEGLEFKEAVRFLT